MALWMSTESRSSLSSLTVKLLLLVRVELRADVLIRVMLNGAYLLLRMLMLMLLLLELLVLLEMLWCADKSLPVLGRLDVVTGLQGDYRRLRVSRGRCSFNTSCSDGRHSEACPSRLDEERLMQDDLIRQASWRV